MADTTNARTVYTIAVIKWDDELHATTETMRITELRVLNLLKDAIHEECCGQVKQGVIRDYWITTFKH